MGLSSRVLPPLGLLRRQRVGWLSMAALLLAGCAGMPSPRVPDSVLEREADVASGAQQAPGQAEEQQLDSEGMQRVPALESSPRSAAVADEQVQAFSDTRMVQVAAEEMALPDYVHYIFGELLGVNYVLDERVSRMDNPITLNLQEPVSQQRLYELSRELLSQNKVNVRVKDELYYFYQATGREKGDIAIGIGNYPGDVPETETEILQVMELNYADQAGVKQLLGQLTNAMVTMDASDNHLFVQGSRADVIKAQQAIRLLDVPAARGRHIGMMRLTYLGPEEFIRQVTELLENEGVKVADRAGKGKLAITALPRLNAVVVFAAENQFLDRAWTWAKQLDVPDASGERRYFVFYPENTNAADLGESLGNLLSLEGEYQQRGSSSSQSDDTASRGSSGSQGRGNRGSGAVIAGPDLSMAVDERSNALLFYASSARYQSLLPMLRQLDVMPGQVIIEATIAEVTLTGNLSYGVEWFLRKGDYTLSTLGGLGLPSGGLQYSLSASAGDVEVLLRALESESSVHLLSSPRLVVRESESANINVGTEVPIITTQATDADAISDRIVQSVQYRSTGVSLDITPTINSGGGMVSLELRQEVSEAGENTLSGVDSPLILQRSVQTTVLAPDGQSVILGGLISENNSDSSTGVPGIGSLPVIGHLFRSDRQSTVRTELIVIITPRILENQQDIRELRKLFTKEYNKLQIK